MLTLVDAIRFITHALKSVLRYGNVGKWEIYKDFRDFQKEKKDKGGTMVSDISECSRDQLDLLIRQIQ